MIRFLVFFGGLTSVGTEISASRLVAPYFGSSTFIWANLIGITLTYLAIGYWLGGRVADTYPRPWLLYAMTTVAALWSILLPYICLLYTSDAADDLTRVDLGGRRII